MDMELKERFTALWRKYFNQAELPLTFEYTADRGRLEGINRASGKGCVMAEISGVRKGISVWFDADSTGCPGGKRYLGFSDRLAPNFEYFLSCGIPGKMEGERYKKTPELVTELLNRWPKFKAPAPCVLFRRWDTLEDQDNPQVVIFFAGADVIAGLFTLFNYDVADPNGVICPMSSGCASIVQNPLVEKDSPNPRAVLGLFDISARPFIGADELTFSLPFNKIAAMVGNMEESFLVTPSWKAIQKRIA
ncbi:MAG: DUF169 domain-containing protein [Dehalococcoidales bacterium]|nr:DUF169 domain-containing protein [Dehalococcoidales bacterium]